MLAGLFGEGCDGSEPSGRAVETGQLRAGAERVEITPAIPSPYNIGVEEIASAVADRLYARILYLEDDDDRLLLIATDWEGLLRTAHDQLRAAVSEASGLPKSQIILNTSHSHNSLWINLDAEALLAEWGYQLVDAEEFARAVQRIAEAAARAMEKAQAARVSVGSGELPELAFNHRTGYVKDEDRERIQRMRRYPIGIADPTLGVVRLDDPDGTPIAVLHVFASHATTSPGAGLLSGSYPGAAMRHIERELGGDMVALFLQGCGGNISPGPLPAGGPGTPVDVAGELFADRALEVLRHDMRPLERSGFTFGAQEVDLALQPVGQYGTLESLERAFRRTAAEYRRRRGRGERPPHWPVVALADRLTLARNVDAWSVYELQALRWTGELTLLFLPGEVFVEYALDLREAIDDRSVFVAAYNDSTPVYIPDPVAFEEGGYEVGPWCYATPRTGTILVEAALDLVGGLESAVPRPDGVGSSGR